MFKLKVYCRRTLNTIPPERALDAPASHVEPAAATPCRSSARVFSCPDTLCQDTTGGLGA